MDNLCLSLIAAFDFFLQVLSLLVPLIRQLRSVDPPLLEGEKENAVLAPYEDDQAMLDEMAAFAEKRDVFSELRGFPGDQMILRHVEKHR